MQQRAIDHEKISIAWNSVVDEVVGDDAKVTGVKLKNTKTKARVLEYSRSSALYIKESLENIEFKYHNTVLINAPILGKHHIPNILASIMMARELGMNIAEIKKAEEAKWPP